MTKKELSDLICPYCNSSFNINKSFIKKNKNIIFGTVYCSCDEFPIIEGILYLHKNRAKKIVDSLKKHRLQSATIQALSLSRIKNIFFTLFRQFNKSFKISPNNLINRILIIFIFKIPAKQFRYYFSRNQEIESLLFFMPLSLKRVTNNSLWLDVGSGIMNYYDYLHHIYPKLKVISVENLFTNIYLSNLFFPHKNVTYICSDFTTGLHSPIKTIDIITFIDSFPFIEKQKSSLKLASSLLKKNGLLYISSLVEHIYLNDSANTYPLSTKLIKTFLSTPCQIFDEAKLCQKLFIKKTLQSSLLSSSLSPEFRYSLLWPCQTLPERVFIPSSLVKNKYTQWVNPDIQWRNRVY